MIAEQKIKYQSIGSVFLLLLATACSGDLPRAGMNGAATDVPVILDISSDIEPARGELYYGKKSFDDFGGDDVKLVKIVFRGGKPVVAEKIPAGTWYFAVRYFDKSGKVIAQTDLSNSSSSCDLKALKVSLPSVNIKDDIVCSKSSSSGVDSGNGSSVAHNPDKDSEAVKSDGDKNDQKDVAAKPTSTAKKPTPSSKPADNTDDKGADDKPTGNKNIDISLLHKDGKIAVNIDPLKKDGSGHWSMNFSLVVQASNEQKARCRFDFKLPILQQIKNPQGVVTEQNAIAMDNKFATLAFTSTFNARMSSGTQTISFDLNGDDVQITRKIPKGIALERKYLLLPSDDTIVDSTKNRLDEIQHIGQPMCEAL